MIGSKGKSSDSNWENDHSRSTAETALKLANVLEKDVKCLFCHKVQGSHIKSADVV